LVSALSIFSVIGGTGSRLRQQSVASAPWWMGTLKWLILWVVLQCH
jgi:hypothetical protein